MNVRNLLILWLGLCFSSACTTASTPTPIHLASPTPVPVPTVTVMPPRALLPTPGVGGGNVSPDVPACTSAESVDQPVKFPWAGIDDIVRDTPETNWTYYRCGEAQSAMSAFYRQWMVQPPYNWIQAHWEERVEATMGVYFHKDPDRWLYLWFLPEKSGEQTSYLVLAWWDVRPSC